MRKAVLKARNPLDFLKQLDNTGIPSPLDDFEKKNWNHFQILNDSLVSFFKVLVMTTIT